MLRRLFGNTSAKPEDSGRAPSDPEVTSSSLEKSASVLNIRSDPVPIQFKRSKERAVPLHSVEVVQSFSDVGSVEWESEARSASPGLQATWRSGGQRGQLNSSGPNSPETPMVTPSSFAFSASGGPQLWRVPLKPASSPEGVPANTVLSVERTTVCPYCRRPAMPKDSLKESRNATHVIRAGVRQVGGDLESSSSSTLSSSTRSEESLKDGSVAYCNCGRTKYDPAEESQDLCLPVYLVHHNSTGLLPGTLAEYEGSTSSVSASSEPLHCERTKSQHTDPCSFKFSRPGPMLPSRLPRKPPDPETSNTARRPAMGATTGSSSAAGPKFKFAVVSPLTLSSLHTAQRQQATLHTPPSKVDVVDVAMEEDPEEKSKKAKNVQSWLEAQPVSQLTNKNSGKRNPPK